MVLVFKFWLMITLMTASERRRTTTTPIDNSQWARNVNTSTKTIKGTKKEKICHSANINRKIYWENFIAMLLFLAIEMFLFSFEFPTLLKSLIWNSKKSGKFKMILHNALFSYFGTLWGQTWHHPHQKMVQHELWRVAYIRNEAKNNDSAWFISWQHTPNELLGLH